MTVEIRPVDPADEAALRRWWEVGDEAVADRPFPGLNPTWETVQATMTTPHPDFDQTLLAAHEGDDVVGVATLVLPVADNLSMSYADVSVPPRHRRRGVGSALLADVEARAGAAGRRYVLVEVLGPVGAGEAGPGERFAAARGYPVAHHEQVKVLDLRDHPDWSPLARRVADRLGGYHVVEWGAHTPPEHQQAVCDALNQFIGLIPLGDVALENTAFTPERLARNEARAEAMGRRRFCAVAFAPDGSLVGYTDVFVPPHVDHRAEIGITMVLPEHRGHALGLAMKLATHASLQEAVPTCRLVSTSNADVNEAMNNVNEQMGYRLVERLVEVQREL